MLGYDTVTQRSNPFGMAVNYSLESAQPIVRVAIDFEDGEPQKIATYPPTVGSDGRYFPGQFVKPTRNGTFPVVVYATDAQGRVGVARCSPGVTVTP